MTASRHELAPETRLRQLVIGDYGPKAPGFFESCVPQPLEQPEIILVTHAVRGLSGLLFTLERVGRIALVVVKPNSIDRQHFEWLSQDYAVTIGNRTHMDDTLSVIDLVGSHVNIERPFLICDIGGYFAPQIEILKKHFGDRFLGVVEDTENGLQRYEAVTHLSLPVLSIARSEVKLPEDQMVGRWIVRSWAATLTDLGRLEASEDPVVLGFGKVGASIASTLKTRGHNPRVVETDPLRAVLARGQGYDVGSFEHHVGHATAIFAATGNRSLGTKEAPQLRPGVVVLAATSRDDEFDFPGLVVDWRVSHTGSRGLKVYRRPDGAVISMVNDGYSANFAFPEYVEVQYLAPAHAALGIAAANLASGTQAAGVASLDREAQARIAEQWLIGSANEFGSSAPSDVD